MSRAALLLVLFVAQGASASDLPPGALVRLGDDRFRAGSGVECLALSPDGKQFATARRGGDWHHLFVAVWDADTGRVVRETELNGDLFHGLAWRRGGGFAVVPRVDRDAKTGAGTLVADDFRVWDFADPKAARPPLFDRNISFSVLNGQAAIVRPKAKAEYKGFVFSADGRRVAALYKTARGAFAVHVSELRPTHTAGRLTRVGLIDLGAEADEFHLSADGRTLVTVRKLPNENPKESPSAVEATTWDVGTGKPAKPVPLWDRGRRMLTPDGRAFVVPGWDEKEWGFDLVDLATGKERKLIRWPRAPEDGAEEDGAFAFFPSGKALAVSVGRGAVIIDLATGKELGRLEGHASAPTAIAVSADETRIATADDFGLVRLWDAKTLRPLHDAPGHRAPVEHAELSPDGKRLVTWADDETVRVWDMKTGKELRAFPGAPAFRGLAGYLHGLAFTPDGAAVLFNTGERLIARDILTGLEVPLPGGLAKLKPSVVVFAPDGKSVLTWEGHSREFAVWDWPGGKKRFAVEGARDPESPGFSPDGAVVFAHAASPERWDAKTGKELAPAWKDERTNQVDLLRSLRPNPRWLLHDPGEDGPRVIEAGTGKRVPLWLARADEDFWLVGAWGVALSPTGVFAVSLGLEPGEVILCESATSVPRRTLVGHRGAIRVLGFTPDGSRLLTAGGDHTILTWDVRVQAMPLTDAVKKEKSAAKLWATLATGKADEAYLAMARLATEPDTAVKMVRMRLKPAAKGERETDATKLTDSRAVELLEALDTDESRKLLKELAGGHADAFRTREARRALERNGK